MTIALYVIAWLFIGNLIRRVSIKRWKKETETYTRQVSALERELSYRLKDKPTVRFWLLFPITAHCRDTCNSWWDPPMVSEIDDQTTAIWHCVLLLPFWPLKVVFNTMALTVIFLSYLVPRILNYGYPNLNRTSEMHPPPS